MRAPFAFASLLLCLAPPAMAVDALHFEFGQGSDTRTVRAGLIRHWDAKWFAEGQWHLTGYWQADLAYWQPDGPGGKAIWSLGLAPVWRLRPNATGGTQPYWELAIGPHLISRTRVDNDRDLGTAIQFAESIGVGITFGDKTRYDLGYRLQHLSNAGMQEAYDGITLHQVRLSYLY